MIIVQHKNKACNYFFKLRRYFSPHAAISCNTDFRDKPVFVSVYSTRGGTSAKTRRSSNLLSSSSLKFAVSTFWEHPTLFFNSPKRLVPVSKSRMISTFHLFHISFSNTATGQGGNFFLVIIFKLYSISFFLATSIQKSAYFTKETNKRKILSVPRGKNSYI